MEIRKIYIRPIGGLCNRMRAIDSALSFARDTDRELIVIWENTHNFNCDLFAIFELIHHFKIINIDLKSITGKFNNIMNYPKNKIIPSRGVLKNMMRNMATRKYDCVLYNDDFKKTSNFIFANNKNISMTEFDNVFISKINAINKYEPFNTIYMTGCYRFYGDADFSLFKPVSRLQKIINRTTNSFNNTIGVHIRRGDHKKAISKSPLKMFIDSMNSEISIDPNVHFF